MSEVICSWTGSRLAFSIFIRNSTNHHRSAPDRRCRSLFTSSRPPFLCRVSREGPTLYTVIYTRTPRHGWSLSRQTAWCRYRCDRIPPAGPRPQDCLYRERSTLGPSADSRHVGEWPPTCGKINLLGNVILSL